MFFETLSCQAVLIANLDCQLHSRGPLDHLVIDPSFQQSVLCTGYIPKEVDLRRVISHNPKCLTGHLKTMTNKEHIFFGDYFPGIMLPDSID